MNVFSHLILHFTFIVTYTLLELNLSAGWLFAMAFLCYFILMTRRPFLHVIAVIFMTGHFIASALQSFLLGVSLFTLLNIYCISIDDSFLHSGNAQKVEPQFTEISPAKTTPTDRARRRVMSPKDSGMLSNAVEEARERERIRANKHIDDLLKLKRVETIE